VQQSFHHHLSTRKPAGNVCGPGLSHHSGDPLLCWPTMPARLDDTTANPLNGIATVVWFVRNGSVLPCGYHCSHSCSVATSVGCAGTVMPSHLSICPPMCQPSSNAAGASAISAA